MFLFFIACLIVFRFCRILLYGASPKCEDVDQQALTYSEIKALCTGDERIKEKLMLDNEVKELKALASEHQNTVYEIRLSFYDLALYLITGICLIFLPTVFLSKQNIISGVR